MKRFSSRCHCAPRKSGGQSIAVSTFSRRALFTIALVSGLILGAGKVNPLAASEVWTSKKLTKDFYAEGGAVGDFDSDGNMDIVAGPLMYFGPNFDESVSLEQVGPHSINGYSQHFFSYVYDVDQDGLVDILTVGFPGEAGYWHKNPGGSAARKGDWKKFVTLSSIDNESPMFVDLDGRGRLSLICCHSGNFGFAQPGEQADAPWIFHPIQKDGQHQRFTHGIGVGDVDDDGLIDILSKDGWWKRPDGENTGKLWEFIPFPFSGPGGAQMYAVDLDADGKTEVVTSLAAHGYGLAVYKKKDAGGRDWQRIDVMTDNIETSPTRLAISQLHAIEMVDMDNDGQLDILTGKRFWAHQGNDPGENEPAYLVWFKPIVTGSGLRFAPNLIDNDSGVGTQITAADIDLDGQIDVLSVSKRGIHVLTRSAAAQNKDDQSDSIATMSVPIQDELGGFRPAWSADKIVNLDFETGDLTDWIATGATFFNQPVKGDVIHARRADSVSGHQGEYWLGGFEVTGDIATGTLTSSTFVLPHAWLSYLQGGGQGDFARVDIVLAESNEVLVSTQGTNNEEMKYYVHHLPDAVGKAVYIRIVDEGTQGWGHVNFDDFRTYDAKPTIPSHRVLLPPDKITYKSLPPDRVADAMTLPEGFKVQVIANEPQVRQPIAMTIDPKGRVWVAEAYQYPIRAEGDFGKDRVLIFEDTDGDGTLDSSKVFIDNLNLVSGIEVGMGGLWVGAAPHLLFIPDKDGDDVPDGPAIKKLTGWGYQDTHETLNSFIWGPDGWLYGCHGVFTHSDVRVVKSDGTVDESVPGIKINAGIWRYRPQTETFEVFAHGTSNPWGLDFNDTGDAFLTACVIPHLYHIIPQARYQRQAGTHFNPYTYADIHTIALHRHWTGDNPHAGNNRSDTDGGGHAHSGAMFYLGGSWPEKYRNQLFMNNIHGARLNQDHIAPRGSGYVGDRAPDFLLANDQSSQILYFRSGPDGQVIAIDWYDAQQCHIVDPAQHDQSNGRIYRIAYGDAPTVQVNLNQSSDAELVEHQLNPNEWFVRTSRTELMKRASTRGLEESTLQKLRQVGEHKEARIRLRSLWTLAACRELLSIDIQNALKDSDPQVRGWAIRMIAQWRHVAAEKDTLPSNLTSQLVAMAKQDPSPVVRLELSALCQELPATEVTPIVLALVSHSEDQDDHNLPLMYWYAASRLIQENPKIAGEIQKSAKIPLVLQYASRQITQMWMDKPELAEQFTSWVGNSLKIEDDSLVAAQLEAILQALEAKRSVAPPPGWSRTANALLSHTNEAVRQRGIQLATKLSDESAMKSLFATAQDGKASVEERIAAINVLKQIRAEGVSEVAFSMLDKPGLRTAALSAIAESLDSQQSDRLMAIAKKWESRTERRQAWFAILRRPTTALQFLNKISKDEIPASELTADMVQQIVQLNSDDVQMKLKEVWGEARSIDQDKKELFSKFESIVNDSSHKPDVEHGKAVFNKICGQCHVLFGEGGKIGPELTGSNRRDLNYLLENILDPSAVMAKEYQPWIVRTRDDQIITGLLKSSDENSLKLQTATEEVVVYNDDIDEKKQSQTSMMPSDLLSPLSTEEIQALFDYLRSER